MCLYINIHTHALYADNLVHGTTQAQAQARVERVRLLRSLANGRARAYNRAANGCDSAEIMCSVMYYVMLYVLYVTGQVQIQAHSV